MKKAKIVLSAVALFAVVGGAFAFSAAKFGRSNVYYRTTTAGGATTCLPVTSIYQTNAGSALISTYTAPNCPALVQTFTTTLPE